MVISLPTHIRGSPSLILNCVISNGAAFCLNHNQFSSSTEIYFSIFPPASQEIAARMNCSVFLDAKPGREPAHKDAWVIRFVFMYFISILSLHQ